MPRRLRVPSLSRYRVASVECLESRITPSAVTLSGSAGYTLHVHGSDLEVVDAEQHVLYTEALAAVTTLDVDDASSVDDVLTIDFSGGNPIPLTGVMFAGTSPSQHGIAFVGDLTSRAVYTPDGATPGSGTVLVDENASAPVTFSGLSGTAPLELSAFASAGLALPNSGASLTVAAGLSPLAHAAAVVSGSSGGVAFAAVAFDENTAVTVDSSLFAGADTVGIHGLDYGQGNLSFTLKAGSGADAVTLSSANALAGSLDLASGAALSLSGTTTVGGDATWSAGGLLDFGGILQRSTTDTGSALLHLTGGSGRLHGSIGLAAGTTASTDVTLSGPMLVSGDTSVSTTGDIIVAGALDNTGSAGHGLTFSGASVDLQGAIGATAAIQSLTATTTGDIDVSSVKTLAGISLHASQNVNLHGAADAGGGDFAITAASLDVDSAASLAGHGALILQPGSAANSIGLAASSGSHDFTITQGTAGRFIDGFSSIAIGRADGTGAIDVGDVTIHDPLILRTSTGTITIGGSLIGTGNASFLLSAGAGHIALESGAAISTESQSVTFIGPVTLDGDAQVLTNTVGSGADILANSLIDGAHRLTLSGGAAGVITLGGAVGSATPLIALLLSGDTFNLPAIAATGSEDFTAHHINLNGGIALSGPNTTLTFDGQVIVNGSLTLATGGGAGNAIGFSNSSSVTVNGALTLKADGMDLHGVVPGTASATLTLLPVAVGADIDLGGAGALPGTLVLTPSDFTAIAPGFAKTTVGYGAGSGTLTIEGASFAGPVLLQSPLGKIIGLGMLTAVGDATLTAKTVQFGGMAGDGSVPVLSGQGAIAVNGTVLLQDSAAVAAIGNVTIGGTVTDPGGASNWTVSSQGTVELTRYVTVTGNQSYTGAAIHVAEPMTSTGNGNSQFYHGPVTLTDSATPISFNTANGNITFGSTLDSFRTPQKEFMLSAGTGAVKFLGDVGSLQAVNRFRIFSAGSVAFGTAVAPAALHSAGIVSIAADVIALTGPVNSVTNSAITLTPATATSILVGGPAVSQPGVLDLTDADLAALAGSAVTLGRAGTPLTVASNIAPLAGTGGFLFSGSKVTVAAATLDAGQASLTFAAPTELSGANSAVQIVTHGAGTLTFNGTLDSASGSTVDLKLQSAGGNIGLNGGTDARQALGAVTIATSGATTIAKPLFASSLTTDAGGSTLLAAGVTTTGSQLYGDPVAVAASVTLTGGSASGLRFADTVSSAKPFSLTTSAGAGGIEFVGQVSGLSGLAARATGNTIFDGTVLLPATTSVTLAGNSVSFGDSHSTYGTLSIAATQAVSIGKGGPIDLGTWNLAGNLTVTAAGAITDSGNATVHGNATFTAGGGASITLNSTANHYSGAVSFSTTGAGNVTISNSNALMLGASTIGGSFTAYASGAITQNGALTVAGPVALTAKSTTPADITLSQAANSLGTVSVAARNVVLMESGAVDLGLSSITGTLTVSAGGAITDHGNVGVNGASNFTTSSGGITLDSIGNKYVGAIGFNLPAGNDVLLLNSRPTLLGPSAVGGNLQVQSSGSITQTGTLGIGGTASFAAGTASDVLLGPSGNDFNAVTIVSARNVRLFDINSVVLNASPINGSLDVTASNSITQSGPLSVSGAAGFTMNAANSTVALTDPGNLLAGAVSFNASGLANGEIVSLVNARATVLGLSHIGGALALNSAGAVSDIASVQVNGTADFTATGSIVLDTASNQYGGAVTFTGSSLSAVVLANARSTVLGSSTLPGTLRVSSPGGDITQTGPLQVAGVATFGAGNSNITLGNPGNVFHTVQLSTTAGASIGAQGDLDFGATSIGFNLLATATGAITQSGNVGVNSLSSFNAGADITLAAAGNKFVGAISLAPGAGHSVSLANARATLLGTSMITGAVQLTSAGTVGQTGPLSVTGETTVTAGGYDVMLSRADNHFTTVAVPSARNETLGNAASLLLDSSQPTGSLSVTVAGSISQSGALLVGGASTFVVSGGSASVVLTSSSNLFTGLLSFNPTNAASGENVTVANGGLTALGASFIGGNLALTTAGNLSQYGALSVAGTSDFVVNAGVNPTTNVTLTNTANQFTGAITFEPAAVGTLSLTNGRPTILGAATLSGNLTVRSAGTITQAAGTGLSASGGTASFIATSGDITLDSAANDLTTVALSTAGNGNATAQSLDSLAIAPSQVPGTLSLVSGGQITETASFTAGTLTMQATGAITLDGAHNKFVTLGTTSAGGTIDLLDGDGGLTLSGIISSSASGVAVRIATAGGGLTFSVNSQVQAANGDIIVAIAHATATQKIVNNSGGMVLSSLHYAVYGGSKIGNTFASLPFDFVLAGLYDPNQPAAAPTANVFYY